MGKYRGKLGNYPGDLDGLLSTVSFLFVFEQASGSVRMLHRREYWQTVTGYCDGFTEKARRGKHADILEHRK